MSATTLLFNIMGENIKNFSKKEIVFIENELFMHLYNELITFFIEKYSGYLRTIKFNNVMEIEMVENNFLSLIINDILSTNEYSLAGIAYYTQTSEDVIYDITIGMNNNPSLNLSKKIVDIHRIVRPTLYQEILRKIIENSNINI